MAVPTTSAPEFEEIPVTDYDFHFLYGGTQSFTLYPNDTFVMKAKTFEVDLANGAKHIIYLDKVAFYSTLSRIQRKAIAKAPPKVSADVQ